MLYLPIPLLPLYKEYTRAEIDRVIELWGLEEVVKSHEEALEFMIEENILGLEDTTVIAISPSNLPRAAG